MLSNLQGNPLAGLIGLRENTQEEKLAVTESLVLIFFPLLCLLMRVFCYGCVFGSLSVHPKHPDEAKS